ncbi:MAG TPA: dihydroorotase, partial [Candidatus Limnocylindria bacterium]|nr:dihydroorotase [Candidatus Limnocylindria bacterium]
RAAARGGYTMVCLQPDEARPLDRPEAVARMVTAAAVATGVRVMAGAAASGNEDRLAELGALAEAGATAVVAPPGSSAAQVRSALLYLAPLGLPLVVRPEDASLAGARPMRAGPTATRLGLSGWPASAEVVVVERDIALAEEVGGGIHLASLSTGGALDAVRRARARGVDVTCDVTPHHLALSDRWIAGDRRFAWDAAEPRAFDDPLDPQLAYDGACRVDPPLASRADAAALLTAVDDGSVDAIATDHRPQPPQRKVVEFSAATPGIVGLQTALSLGLAAAAAGRIDLVTLLAALSSRAAMRVGERRGLAIGQPADLVIFDPTATWQVEREALASVHANTPLLGRELPGVVRLTVAAGRLTYDDLGPG